MLRFLIKVPTDYTNDNKLINTYSNAVLQAFKSQLLKDVDYNKIKIRYDYLIRNNILQFNNSNNVIGYKQLVELLVNQFKVQRTLTINNNYSTSIFLNNYILIPNANMSFANFYKFIEYGNIDIKPYHWVLTAWNKVKKKYDNSISTTVNRSN